MKTGPFPSVEGRDVFLLCR